MQQATLWSRPWAVLARRHPSAFLLAAQLLSLLLYPSIDDTTSATAPNSRRPPWVSSIDGYSSRLSSCAASRKADGWRRAMAAHGRDHNDA
jgi:hypothetical protein